MIPQWIPQNIQKRLLLYVLQQLSLFSEIDLPNLEEVSLNNIILKDVALDPEKVGKLPGCNLRYGQIGSLELTTISGISGVNIDVNDAEIVISPDFDIDENMTNQVAFLLAQSTANLANTIMLNTNDGSDMNETSDPTLEDDDEDDIDDKITKPIPPKRRTSSVTGNKTTALGGVMQKAVEIALLRLLIKINSLKIKIVSDLTDLQMEVDSVSINSTNGTRTVSIKGVKLRTLKPNVNPGEGFQSGHAPQKKQQGSDNDSPTDANKHGSENDNDDDDDDYGNESLMDSMVFSHEEASSIYMSATSRSFEKSAASGIPGEVDNKATDKEDYSEDPPIIFYMDDCTIEFDGLSTISNLEIEVGNINLAFTPLTPTLVSIFQGVAKSLKIKYYQQKKKTKSRLAQRNEKFPQYTNDNDEIPEDQSESDDASHEPFFNRFKVNSFVISATSALSENGLFANKNGINIIFFNINIKQKNELLLYGGVETFKIIRFEDDNTYEIFHFDKPQSAPSSAPSYSGSNDVAGTSSSSSSSTGSATSKADIRFEVFKKSEESDDLEVTVLMAKSAHFNFDLQSLLILSNFAKAVSSIYDEYGLLKSVIDKLDTRDKKWSGGTNNSKMLSKSEFILQTATIFVNFIISDDCQLQLIVFPIKFNLLQEQLTISKILLNCTNGDTQVEGVIILTDVSLITKNQEFRAYFQSTNTTTSANTHPLPRKTTMNSKLSVIVQKFSLNVSMDKLKFIGEKLKNFSNEFIERSPTQSNSLENSFLNEPVERQRLESSLHMNSSLFSTRRPGRRLGLGFNNSPSVFLGSTRVTMASFQVCFKEATFNITGVFPKFGNFSVQMLDISFYKLKNDILGHILSVLVQRKKGDLVENLIHQYQDLSPNSLEFPLLLIKCKLGDKTTKIEITARNLVLEYYTNWLLLMDKEESIIDAVEEEIIEKVTPSQHSSSQNKLDIRYSMYDCMVGLTPGRLSCKSYLIIGKGDSDISFGVNQFYVKCSFRNISMVLIDDTKNILPFSEPSTSSSSSSSSATRQTPYVYIQPLDYYSKLGYIHLGLINVAHVGITFNTDIEALKDRNEKLGIKDSLTFVDLKTNLDECQFNLCADTANTLIQLVNDLKLPLNFRDEDKMKVDFADGINVMQGIDQNIFKGLTETLTELNLNGTENGSTSESSSQEASSLMFEEGHFDRGNRSLYDNSHVDPLHININLSKVKIYLHDGYDWKDTRKAIRGAVKNFETAQTAKTVAKEKEKKRKVEFETRDIEVQEDVFQETLFQSIHVVAPRNQNARDMATSINLDLQNDKDGESRDVSTANSGKSYKNLKLRRSAKHKLLFDLKSIEVGVNVYSTRDPRRDKTDENMKYELLNFIELRVGTVDIYDNVSTSTWNKFLSYMNILGDREIGTSMVKVSILNVRPDPAMVSGEAIMNVSVLPLRLHIDQDALDFLVRFFEFKDERFELPPDEMVYIQKFEISSIKLKLDYKPKKVDYAGLRSGKAGEFANFFTLDGSTLTLPKVKLFGIPGAPKIGIGLGRAWLPVFQLTQVIGIISGVSPLRSVVNIGGGFKDLVAIPISEYKKDGRLWRSIQKGTVSFAKTTGYEILNLGVKLASGTQVLLEQGEEMLGGEGSSVRSPNLGGLDNRRNSNASDELPVEVAKPKSQNNLLVSSQILNKASTKIETHSYDTKKLYSNIELDDEDMDDNRINGINKELLSKSIFLLAPAEEKLAKLQPHTKGNHEGLTEEEEDEDEDEEYQLYAYEDEEELQEKLVSLYSNQPETIEQGLKSAYKSLGTNFKLTKKQLLKLRRELAETDTIQDSMVTVLKNSPIILMRPLIGSTEAVSKLLMGVGNQIDGKKLVEKKDKYPT